MSFRLGQIGFSLPLVVLIAFIFQKPVLLFVDPILFSHTPVSHLPILRDQYAFLSRTTFRVVDDGDFHLFELFIWIGSVLGTLRLLVGLCSRATLASSRETLKRMTKVGGSTLGVLGFFLLFVPFCIFCSLCFHIIGVPVLGAFLIQQSPRIFIFVATFVFCVGVFGFVEGLLFLASLIFVRVPTDKIR